MKVSYPMNPMNGLYCLMNAGGLKMTPMLADVLLTNAIDMYSERRRRQRVKGPKYDGVIESDLQVIEYIGMQCVTFTALLGCDMWEAGEIRFLVRVDFEIPSGKWFISDRNGIKEAT